MKVLLVTDTFPPDINGVAGTLHTLSRGLINLGHEVEIVTTLEAGMAENVPAASLLKRHVVASVPLPGYPGLRVGLAATWHVQAMIEKFRPDVLYVATETPLGIAAIRAAGKEGIPVVSGFHTNFHTYLEEYHLPGLEAVAAAFLRTLHNHTARTLTPSLDTAEELRRWGIANVGVMGRGVDTDLFNPARRDPALRAAWGADDDTPVAVFVGRLAAEKNLPLAVRGFEAFREVHPHAPCVFVGGGPREKWLQEEHGEFLFAGARRGEDLARYYASADVFLFPSLSETFGNVLLESMASGLVSVAFDYAAARQHLAHGENGWVAEFGNENCFLDQVRTAALRWNDRALRRAARRDALAVSWTRVIRQFEAELAGACGYAVVDRGASIPATIPQQPPVLSA